jgi:hypothetical protein
VDNKVPKNRMEVVLRGARGVNPAPHPWSNERITIIHLCLDTLLMGNNLATVLGLLLDNTRTKSLVDVINMTFNFAGVDDEDLFEAVQAKGKELEQLLKPIFAYDLYLFWSSHVSLFLQGAWSTLLCAGDLPFGRRVWSYLGFCNEGE